MLMQPDNNAAFHWTRQSRDTPLMIVSTVKSYVCVVTRQQKQQQGNQLAKETDRLIKAFTALPVGPDQVLNSKISCSSAIL